MAVFNACSATCPCERRFIQLTAERKITDENLRDWASFVLLLRRCQRGNRKMNEKQLFMLSSALYWSMQQLISHCVCCPPACLSVCLSVPATCYQNREQDSPSAPGSLSFAVCLLPAALLPLSSLSLFLALLPLSLSYLFYQRRFSLLSHTHLSFLSCSDAHLHILLCSSNVRRCLLPPYGLSTYSRECGWCVAF